MRSRRRSYGGLSPNCYVMQKAPLFKHNLIQIRAALEFRSRIISIWILLGRSMKWHKTPTQPLFKSLTRWDLFVPWIACNFVVSHKFANYRKVSFWRKHPLHSLPISHFHCRATNYLSCGQIWTKFVKNENGCHREEFVLRGNIGRHIIK